MTGILSPSVASHDEYSYPYTQESLNPLLQCPPSTPQIPVQSAEIPKFWKYVKHTSSLRDTSSLNLKLLIINMNLNA